MSAPSTEGWIAGEQLVHGQAFIDAQAVQYGGLDPSIRRLTCAEHLLIRCRQIQAMSRPMGHWLREHHHGQGKPEHCRIERVFADAAVHVLAEQQTRSHGRYRQPPGAIRWQGSSQQCRADQRAAVAQRWLQGLSTQVQDRCFDNQCCGGRQNQIDQHPPTVQPEQSEQPRQSGQQYQLHCLLQAIVRCLKGQHDLAPGARRLAGGRGPWRGFRWACRRAVRVC
ncbi:hypothetical protein D3C81_1398720 [compost metagenome]